MAAATGNASTQDVEEENTDMSSPHLVIVTAQPEPELSRVQSVESWYEKAYSILSVAERYVADGMPAAQRFANTALAAAFKAFAEAADLELKTTPNGASLLNRVESLLKVADSHKEGLHPPCRAFAARLYRLAEQLMDASD